MVSLKESAVIMILRSLRGSCLDGVMDNLYFWCIFVLNGAIMVLKADLIYKNVHQNSNLEGDLNNGF